MFALRQVGGLAVRPHVERENNRAGSRSQQHVVFGHRADARTIIFSFTWSVESFGSISLSTSTEPCTSALMTIGSSLTSPALSCSCNWSSVMRAPLDRASLRVAQFALRGNRRCAAPWLRRSPGSGRPLPARPAIPALPPASKAAHPSRCARDRRTSRALCRTPRRR